MTWEKLLQDCIDSGFDNFDKYLMKMAKALDKADIKPEEEKPEGT